MNSINPKSIPFIYSEKLYKLEGEKKSEFDISFHGTNLKNITILVDDVERVYEGLEFTLLTGILKAIGLVINDVAIVDAFGQGHSLKNIKNQLLPVAIIAFGNDFPQTPGPKNTLTEVSGLKVIVTDSLKDLQEDESKKIPFWTELRKLAGSFS
jgi:hypothetical protein